MIKEDLSLFSLKERCGKNAINKIFASAARFMMNNPVFETIGKEILELSKQNERYLKSTIYNSPVSYSLIYKENPTRYGLSCDLQKVMQYCYEETKNGYQDDTIIKIVNIFAECSDNPEFQKGMFIPRLNKANGTLVDAIVNVSTLENEPFVEKIEHNEKSLKNIKELAKFMPLIILDIDIMKKYYVYFSEGEDKEGITVNEDKVEIMNREEVEQYIMDGKHNFRLYVCLLYGTYLYGLNYANAAEASSINAFFAGRKFHLCGEMGKENMNIVPQNIKRCKSVFDFINENDDEFEYMDEIALSILSSAGVEITDNRLYKNDINNIVGVYSNFKSFLDSNKIEYEEEELIKNFNNSAPFSFLLYSLAIEYKKLASQLSAEKCVVVSLEKNKTDNVALLKKVKELESALCLKEKEEKELQDLLSKRKEKNGKLEKKIVELELEIEKLKEENDKVSSDIFVLSESIGNVFNSMKAITEDSALINLVENYKEVEEENLEEESKDLESINNLEETEAIDYKNILKNYSENLNLIIAGCTMSMIKKIEEKYPKIKCTYGKEVTTMEQTFKSADYIFIHTTSISHKQFRKILSVNKNVRYINRMNNLKLLEKEIVDYLDSIY